MPFFLLKKAQKISKPGDYGEKFKEMIDDLSNQCADVMDRFK